MALTDKIVAIADAIREKAGTTDKMTMDEMVTAIGDITTGGGDSDDWTIDLRDINLAYLNYQGRLDSVINMDNINKGKIIFGTNNSSLSGMKLDYDCYAFSNSNNKYDFRNTTFYIRDDSSSLYLNSIFASCNLLYPPHFNFFNQNNKIYTMAGMFQSAKCLIDASYVFENFAKAQSYLSNLFQSCISLRKGPTTWFDVSLATAKISTRSLYYQCFQNCYALEYVVNYPVQPAAFTANAFVNTFDNNFRLKQLTFASTTDSVAWPNQVIDLSSYVGYGSSSYGYSEEEENGLSSKGEVSDDTTYAALKDTDTWWTKDVNYSRYNHDSAVETINSLPTVSGSSNTIKFKSGSGASTDGGAISNLTADEIAVATAKGWTVTLVD